MCMSTNRYSAPMGGVLGLMGSGHLAVLMRRATRSPRGGGVVDQRLESAPVGVDLDVDRLAAGLGFLAASKIGVCHAGG